MTVFNVISLLCGVGLFLFGMSLMGDGLKMVAGGSMEAILYKLSNRPWKGVLLGTGVTAVIQSSSATSIMVVGFVNSGMMKFRQAISVVLGSVLGTSITGWVLSLSSLEGTGWMAIFSTSTLTGLTCIAGTLFRLTGGKSQKHFIGDIMLGFSVLMVGMSTMSSAVSPLKSSELFLNTFVSLTNPVLAILVGVVFAGILQSASAAVGVLQALSMTGVVSFEIAFPMIMGIAIGSSVPVLLSSFGSSLEGRRTSFVFLFINVIGTVIATLLFYPLNMLLHFPFMKTTMNMFHIAAVNSFFRLFIVFALFPFINLLEKLVIQTIHGKPQDTTDESFGLDDRFLRTPPVAISQCRTVISSMANNTAKSYFQSLELMDNYQSKLYDSVVHLEGEVDRQEDKIGTYLMKLTGGELTQQQTQDVSRYLHSLTEFENISDYALNIANAARKLHEKDAHFSEQGAEEIAVVAQAVSEVVTLSTEVFLNDDVKKALQIDPLVRVVEHLCDSMKLHHTLRLQKNQCNYQDGYIFTDLLQAFERIADHCSNIAVAVVALDSNNRELHEELLAIRESNSQVYEQLMQAYSEKYKI